MDGTGARQLPLSSIDLQVTNKGDWAPNRKRSRKPQETFRHQNTDNDDIMSDLIEYGQVDSLAVIETVADKSEMPAMTSQQEFSSGAIDLYRNAVEMWHSEDSESVLESHSADVATNDVELSAMHQFGSLGSGRRFYRDELADDLNVSHKQSMEDDCVIAEDDFMDEDFSAYGNDEDQTGGLASSSSDLKQTKTLSCSSACEICGRSFKGRAQLASHMKSHRHPLHCSICSIRFTSQGTMLWHQRFVHAAQKYNHTCEVCGETLRLKQELISHYMTHRLTKGVVKCRGCGQSFRNTVTLKLHEINLCWRQGKNNNIENEAEKMTTGYMLSTNNEVMLHNEKTALLESQCSSYSTTEDGFVNGGVNCDTNDDGNPDETNPMDCGPLLSYSCPFCGQTFHSKGLYTIHTKKHTKPHSCDLCGRGFAKKFTMECHRKTHLSQKDYHCELCGQSFTLRPQLLKHRADNHEMANGVLCKYCDAKFKHRTLLRRHLSYCCPKAPVNKDGDRVKLDELPESEQGYQCTQCDKTFDTQWALEQHTKYHKRKYSCEICGNKYGERFLLQSHLHTHLGVRPYKCTVCGASFTLKAHCDRHCRMHLRVQHFKCESCGYMFRYEHDRFTHMSKFCLGTKEDKPDLSKMMTIEKPDYEQLGVTSSMLGYAKQPPAKPISSLSSPQQTEQDVPNPGLQEDAQMDALTGDADKKEPVEGEELIKKPLLKCHICGKKLKRKAILAVHLAREHGIGEEPFKCFICGQGAAFEKAMRVHLESHLPYKRYQCTNCGIRFSNKRTLATHALHEKCLSSSFRRPSESPYSDNNTNIEIVFVDEDLSLEPCNAEKDLGLNASCKAILKDSNVITEDELGETCKNSSESYTEMRIKAEIVDSCYEQTNGNLCSSADDDEDNDDEDSDNGCDDDGNDVEDDDETVCGDLSPAEGCEQSNSAEQVQDQFEDIGKDSEKQAAMMDQHPADVDNGRLICVIKKKRNGSGYMVQTQQDEESLESSGNLAAPAVESDKLHDDEKRKVLLSVPLRVKVLRDGFGNERILVNGELFQLWCDYALEATRKGDVNCQDVKEWCEICQWFIVGKYKYRVHMQRHSHDRPFACDVCGKAFKTTENLRTHMRWHDPSRLIVCTICGAKCLSPSDMKRHMTVHEGVKPYVCSTCGKGFRRKMYLNTHVRTHTGETPFSCDICGRRFRIYSSLHDHQKLHSGYKPFECSVCHKRFAQRANWRTHERRHKGVKNFECEVCQKGFVQNYELQNHRLRCVKQDLPYICLLCGMKFTKEHPLKRHINRHSCGICGKQFVIMKEKVSHQLQCRRQSKSDMQLQ